MSNQTFASFINGEAKEDVNYRLYKFAQETDYPIDFGENANWCQQEEEYESGVGVSENLEQTLRALGATLLPSYKTLVTEANKTNEIVDIPMVISTTDATYEGTVWVGNLRAKDGITTDYWLDFNKLKKIQDVTTNPLLIHGLPKQVEFISFSEGKVKREIEDISDLIEKITKKD